MPLSFHPIQACPPEPAVHILPDPWPVCTLAQGPGETPLSCPACVQRLPPGGRAGIHPASLSRPAPHPSLPHSLSPQVTLPQCRKGAPPGRTTPMLGTSHFTQ